MADSPYYLKQCIRPNDNSKTTYLGEKSLNSCKTPQFSIPPLDSFFTRRAYLTCGIHVELYLFQVLTGFLFSEMDNEQCISQIRSTLVDCSSQYKNDSTLSESCT